MALEMLDRKDRVCRLFTISGNILKQIVRFYKTRMKEMGWIVLGTYDEEEYVVSCRKGIASYRIAVSEQKKKRRIGIDIQ